MIDSDADESSGSPGLRELLASLPREAQQRALTHSSYARTPADSYERLEFLGDAVLDLVVAHHLFQLDADASEGGLSQWKAQVVDRQSCAKVARDSGLGEAFVESAENGVARGLATDMVQRDAVLAALTESVIGAAFVELGYDAVVPAILASFGDRIGHARHNRSDSKSELQELAQRRGESVEYRVVSAVGPDHDRTFTVLVRLAASGLEADGEGRTKKAAEQVAALRLLERMDV